MYIGELDRNFVHFVVFGVWSQSSGGVDRWLLTAEMDDVICSGVELGCVYFSLS